MTNDELGYMIDRLEEYETGNAQTEQSFGELHPYEQKKFLCNALGVPTYHSNGILREKLEVIINAI